MFRKLLALAAALVLAACSQPAPPAQPVTVLAASSLQDVLEEAGGAYTADGRGEVRFSFGASSALARQIEQGAPADLFISADEAWMDHVAGKGLIDAASRVDLLGNRLVLVAPAGSAVELTVGAGMPLGEALGADGRLAIAGEEVPAGKYARAALESLDAWRPVEDRLARGENVRTVLQFVARGEAPLGVVYETDARVEPAVKVVGVFPEGSHPPIIYPATLVPAGPGEGADFLAWLQSPDGREVFERYGFLEP